MNLDKNRHLLPCPNCRAVAFVNLDLSQAAKIRCPACSTEFSLAEVVDSQLACWQIVDEMESEFSVASAPVHDDSLMKALAYRDEVTIEPPSDQSGELPLATAELASPAKAATKADWSGFQPITHEQFERMKRKSRSPVWQILQVVLGGLAAIPIALLLVWHLIGTDVAGAGPAVGRIMPWIVPQKFRPYQPMASTESNSDRRPVRRGGFEQPGPTDATALPAENLEPSSGEPVAESPTKITHSAEQPAVQPASGTLAPNRQFSDSAAEAADNENLFEFIRQTSDQLGQWPKAYRSGGADIKTRAQSTYANLCSLAQKVRSSVQQNHISQVALLTELRSVGNQVEQYAEVRSLIQQGSNYWLDRLAASIPAHDIAKTDPKNEFGFAIVITVESAQLTPSDAFVVSASKITRPISQNLEIAIPRSVARNVEAGQKLFLLGYVRPDEGTPMKAPRSYQFVASYVYEL